MGQIHQYVFKNEYRRFQALSIRKSVFLNLKEGSFETDCRCGL
jgi:hypothetical protein